MIDFYMDILPWLIGVPIGLFLSHRYHARLVATLPPLWDRFVVEINEALSGLAYWLTRRL